MTEGSRKFTLPQYTNDDYASLSNTISRTQDELQAIAHPERNRELRVHPLMVLPNALKNAAFFLVMSHDPIAYASDIQQDDVNYYVALMADIPSVNGVTHTITVSFCPNVITTPAIDNARLNFGDFVLEDIAKVRIESRSVADEPQTQHKNFDFTCTYEKLFLSEETGIKVVYAEEYLNGERRNSFYPFLPGVTHPQLSPQQAGFMMSGIRDCSSVLVEALSTLGTTNADIQ